jgi:hypothetical protein
MTVQELCAPRRASETSFPYGWPGAVCYFVIQSGVPTFFRYRDEFRSAVRSALNGDAQIYAAWPGQWRTDLFVIDELARLAKAIELP